MTSARPLSEILPTEMRELRVRPLFVLLADVAPPIIVGNTPGVDRRIGIVTGGRFEGERLRGTILPRRQRLAGHPTRRRRLVTQSSYGS